MNSSQSYGKQKVRFNHSEKVCAQEEISFRCLHFLYTGYLIMGKLKFKLIGQETDPRRNTNRDLATYVFPRIQLIG